MTLAEWLDEYRYLLDTSAEDDLKDIFAQHTKVENFTSTNGSMVLCPTCGAACTIGGDDDEGTHYYVPVAPYRAQHQ